MKFELESTCSYTKLERRLLSQCDICSSLTGWYDSELKKYSCSQKCNCLLWREALSNSHEFTLKKRLELYSQQISTERKTCKNLSKAILIVAHNQHDYLEKCLTSIKKYTQNYKVYLWDNASDPKLDTQYRSDSNLGFIKPNNIMASEVKEDVVICLNSDTEVFEGWDQNLCAYLEDYAQVGYLGCYLDDNLFGDKVGFGDQVDYILGWGFAIKNETYRKYGLFDEELEFAYFEDADLSLRLRKNNEKIYVLYNPLVHHYGNKTVDINDDLMGYVKKNYNVFKEKWGGVFKPKDVMVEDNIWGSAGKKLML